MNVSLRSLLQLHSWWTSIHIPGQRGFGPVLQWDIRQLAWRWNGAYLNVTAGGSRSKICLGRIHQEKCFSTYVIWHSWCHFSPLFAAYSTLKSAWKPLSVVFQAITALFIFIRNRCARDLPPVTPEAIMSRILALVIWSRISALFVRKLLVITRNALDLHLGNCRRARWIHLHISGHISDNMWFYEPLNTKL